MMQTLLSFSAHKPETQKHIRLWLCRLLARYASQSSKVGLKITLTAVTAGNENRAASICSHAASAKCQPESWYVPYVTHVTPALSTVAPKLATNSCLQRRFTGPGLEEPRGDYQNRYTAIDKRVYRPVGISAFLRGTTLSLEAASDLLIRSRSQKCLGDWLRNFLYPAHG